MIKKFRRYFRIARIDLHIYSMRKADWVAFPPIGFEVQYEKLSDGRSRYFIMDQGNFVHQSFLFPQLNVLKLIGRKGPAIGDCVTEPAYKGRSIYPYVINRVAGEMLMDNRCPEVFIIVNSDNISSIRGIEKAGFQLHTKIKAKRFLVFYYHLDLQKLR